MHQRLSRAAVLLIALFAGVLSAGEPAKILFFTKSARFEHSVIKRNGDAPSYAEKILDELGAKHNFKITTTKDGGIFTAENLAKYDAIMFYTSGDLLKPAKDGSPPMTAEGKQLLFDTVKNGKPFIAVHNALATFDKSTDKVDPYIEMIGGESIGHGAQQKARNLCVDAKFPGCEKLGEGFELMEEWYSIKNFSKDVHVILVQDPKGMNGGLYIRPPYPATWARMHGKGRVYATSLGHREDVWSNPLFQDILVGGIQWALGRVEADITPNIETVTPQYATLPSGK
ncbi:MAG TPA: ThuA domain-containing protein [Planctomycetota bacterium]|nr:ThuA domain-containing protein [Planctomycetota bacterium]